VASAAWLQRLRRITEQHGIVLIADDIQVGCGRTGHFFSFEEAGIVPDIVTLSKSLSGYGLPMALVLIRPDLDQWAPGEHNGTFRGHCPAFVTATAALGFWENRLLQDGVLRKQDIVQHELDQMVRSTGVEATVRGRGLIQGVDFADTELASRMSQACFKRGLVIETAGINDQVLKLLPSLTIKEDELLHGLDIIRSSLKEVLRQELRQVA
jgi:diaminobutyrate-2-oxoglutarate transaminase